MTYFLVVFSRSRKTILQKKEFQDADEAVRARFQLEAGLSNDDIEVVVLGAESEEAVQHTHSRYYGGRPELTEVG